MTTCKYCNMEIGKDLARYWDSLHWIHIEVWQDQFTYRCKHCKTLLYVEVIKEPVFTTKLFYKKSKEASK